MAVKGLTENLKSTDSLLSHHNNDVSNPRQNDFLFVCLLYTNILFKQDHEFFGEIHKFTYWVAQQLCESRGGRPGLSVLTSLLVSVNIKQH